MSGQLFHGLLMTEGAAKSGTSFTGEKDCGWIPILGLCTGWHRAGTSAVDITMVTMLHL